MNTKNTFAGVAAWTAILTLAAGCTTIKFTDSTPASRYEQLPALGVVSLSGSGQQPSETALRADLRQQAARNYHVPVDEIVLGPLNFEGVRALGWEPNRMTDGSLGQPHVVDAAAWSVSAEVRRKVPQPG